MCALFLAAIWPAVTSHALLEQAGFIHQVHANGDHHHHPHDPDHRHHHHEEGSHEHNADDHDFADGKYWAKTSPNKTPKPNFPLLYQSAGISRLVTDSTGLRDPNDFGPAPPGALPPELLHRWNFVLRTAVNARAPSRLS